MQDIVPGIIFCMSMMAMTSNYTFSIAEKNDLNRLYGLIPVTKKDIVAGRYMFSAAGGILAALIGLVLNIIVLTLTNHKFTLEETIVGISVGLLMYFFFTAIQLPGFFKFGAIKGRFISFIPFVGLFFVSVIARGVDPESLSKLPTIAVLNNAYAFFVVSILLDIIFYGISMGVTLKMYEKMEL
jgi:hypothetical protein